MDKAAFRAGARERIKELPAEYIAYSDAAIAGRLFGLQEYTDAGDVFAYVSVGREVSTKRILSRSVELGKRVYLPRTRPGGEMDFASAAVGLAAGRYGIPEPPASLPAAEPAGGLIVVPAVCFDRSGMRLGQGGGYYDRFLARFPGLVRAGLCRERLLEEKVPREWNDLAVDYVVTEERIISCERTVPISLADGAGHMDALRGLIGEYIASLGRDISFQRPEEELAALERAYGPPGGASVVALRAGEAVGAACLRRIGGGACEMKRLYVREGYRRLRLGEALARAVIARAKGLGYREMLLDTLEDMCAARRLYARLGFRECGPYYQNPIPGTSYMRLELDK